MTSKETIRLYVRTLSYFRDSTPAIIAQISLMTFGVWLGVLSAFPLAILIDTLSDNHRGSAWEYRLFYHFAPTTMLGQIIALAIIALTLRVGQEVLTMIQTLMGIKAGYRGLLKVRCELFQKLQQLSLSYHQSQPKGDAIYRLSFDTFGFQSILGILSQTMLVSALSLVMMLWVMLSMSWLLTLIALAVIPALFWVSSHYGKIFRERSQAAKQAESDVTTSIQRSVSSIELVQAYGREADELARFESTAGVSVRTYLRLHWDEVCYWLLLGSIFAVGGSLILGFGGYLVYRDQFVLHSAAGFTVGQLSVFLSYVLQLYGPLNKLSNSGSSLQNSVVSVQRVFEVLDRNVTITDAPSARALALQPRTLEFDNLSFAYTDGQPVLREVSLRIEPGQMVAFVGSSGVGKTTLLNLLPRFYDPTAGAIKLDGHDLRDLKLSDLRRHVALVLQENAILPATVRENIAYGRPDADARSIAHAAELAGAADFIEKLPHKYETHIGEGSQNLSGGQRQRLAIARALLTLAPILVLDEPTSALDAQHEAMIIQTLRNLKGQRTIILVSHRLSTVADSSQIFVVENGRIAERGSHDELLALGGVYREMAKHQLKIEETADAPQK